MIKNVDYIFFDGVYTLRKPQHFLGLPKRATDIIISDDSHGHSHPTIIYHKEGWLEIIRHSWNGLTKVHPMLVKMSESLQKALPASLAHDVLLLLIALGHLPRSFRKVADQHFKMICKREGVGWFWLNTLYAGVTAGRFFDKLKGG